MEDGSFWLLNSNQMISEIHGKLIIWYAWISFLQMGCGWTYHHTKQEFEKAVWMNISK